MQQVKLELSTKFPELVITNLFEEFQKIHEEFFRGNYINVSLHGARFAEISIAMVDSIINGKTIDLNIF